MNKLFEKTKISIYPITLSTLLLILYSSFAINPNYSLNSNIETVAFVAGFSLPFWFLFNVIGTLVYSGYFWLSNEKTRQNFTVILTNLFLVVPLLSLVIPTIAILFFIFAKF